MTINSNTILYWCSLLCCFVLCSNSAYAVAPDNDNFNSATRINTLPFSAEQSAVDATLETNEVQPSCAGERVGSSVWYRYTASTTRSIVVETTDSAYDTVLSVWEGAQFPLTELVCNDDNGPPQSKLSFNAVAGNTYHINISSLPANTGTNLILNLSAANSLSNDNLSDATVISLSSSLTFQAQQVTDGATLESNEAAPSCSSTAGASVWYRYTPTGNQILAIDTTGSNYDTVLGLWTGDSFPLTEVACMDDNGTAPQAQLRAVLSANTQYWLQVTGTDLPPAETGVLNLNINAPVSNTTRNNAMTISSLPYETTLSTVGAGMSTFTPSCDTNMDNDVWFAFTPETDQRSVVITTEGSSYNTLLAVWQNSDGDLTELACNDDYQVSDFGQNSSQVTVNFTAGQQYFIQVGGALGSAGDLMLSLSASGNATRDFVITRQPSDTTIQAGETASLSVRIGPTSEFDAISGPISYQWYQGEAGDTSQPVGTDSSSFTTPALTESTQYWVRVSNTTGTRSSSVATVSVEGTVVEPEPEPEEPTPNPEDSNGIGVNTDLVLIATTGNFEGFFVRQSDNLVVDTALETDDVEVSFVITPESAHVGKQARLILVGLYDGIPDTYFSLNGSDFTWVPWNFTIDGLAPLEADKTLTSTVSIPLFEGQLVGLTGNFTFFIGYVLEEDGSLFFGSEPLTFNVQ